MEIGDDMIVGASPYRDAVPEPELAGDVPVADVVHPAQVLLAPAFRMEAQLIRLSDGDCRTRERLHLHPPLRGNNRFDYRAAPIAVADVVPVGLDFL
jgi:hypothetical protein